MFDKTIIVKKHYGASDNIYKDIKIKVFGDIHYSESFDIDKLDRILKYIKENPSDYLCIVGDLLDNVNILENKEKRKKILEWLYKLGKEINTFISYGNHEYLYKNIKDNKWEYKFDKMFWEEVSHIKGIHIVDNRTNYEDENVIICGLDLGYEYYENNENKNILINKLEKLINGVNFIDNNKLKILLCHSPVYLSDKECLKYVSNFDYVLSGHMHNGLIPIFLDNLLKNNRGIISPTRKLFIDNARGIKEIIYNNNFTTLIINGGITKLAEYSGIVRPFNKLYAMNIDEIEIRKKLVKEKKKNF